MMRAVVTARAAAIAAGPGREAVLVSHQLPVWITRLHVEERRLWHDPRRRQCSLASVTSLAYDGDRLVSLTYAEPAAALLPGAATVGGGVIAVPRSVRGLVAARRRGGAGRPHRLRVTGGNSIWTRPQHQSVSIGSTVEHIAPDATAHRAHRQRDDPAGPGPHARRPTGARSSSSTTGAPGAVRARRRRPDLKAAWKQLQGKDVQFIGLDSQESATNGLSYMTAQRADLPSLRWDGGKFLEQLKGKAPAPPTTIILDQQGRLAARVLSSVDTTTLVGLVDDVLSGAGT